jgi:SAM-dependent methyltransferase
LLEIGCGAGVLISELHQLGYVCTAVEESEQAISIAKEFNKETNNQIVSELPSCVNNNFDYLFAFEVLEHIQNDLDALKTWKNHLLPNGKLLFSVPAHPQKWNATDDWAGHVKRYEKEQLVDLVKQAGFDVLHFESYGYPLANILEPIRAFHHSKELKKRSRQQLNTVTDNNLQSGISRNLESKLFFLLKNPIAKFFMKLSISIQKIFLKTNLGNGYIVVATPKDDDL